MSLMSGKGVAPFKSAWGYYVKRNAISGINYLNGGIRATDRDSADVAIRQDLFFGVVVGADAASEGVAISTHAISTVELSVINLASIIGFDNFLAFEGGGKTNALFILEAFPSQTTQSSYVYGDQGISVVPIAVGNFTALDAAESPIRVSTRDWTGNPDDTQRPDMHFIGRLADIDFERSIPLLPNSESRIALTQAEFSLANNDGFFDSVINGSSLSIDNREINVYLLPSRSADFSEKATVFAGVGNAWVPRKDALAIKALGINYSLSSPLLNLYGGTGGGDGTAALTGLPIMEVFGQCLNVSPQIVDPTKLIYRFHAGLAQSVDGVYVRGAPVTAGVNRADYTALAASAPTAGQYDYTLTANGSFIRLGSNPDGIVTMDVKGDATGGYVNTVAMIARRLLLRGIDASRIDEAGFASMNAIAAGAAGICFTEQTTVEAAVSKLAMSIAGFWGDRGDGLLTIGRLNVPSGSSGILFDTTNVYDEVTPDTIPDDIYPSVYRAIATHAKNWTPMTAQDIVAAPTITETRRTELQQPYKTAQFLDNNRLLVNPNAKSLPVLETYFVNSSDAQAIADTQGNIYQAGRQLYTWTVGYSGYGLRLNDEVKLMWPRYGLTEGKHLRIARLRNRGRFVTITGFG